MTLDGMLASLRVDAFLSSADKLEIAGQLEEFRDEITRLRRIVVDIADLRETIQELREQVSGLPNREDYPNSSRVRR